MACSSELKIKGTFDSISHKPPKKTSDNKPLATQMQSNRCCSKIKSNVNLTGIQTFNYIKVSGLYLSSFHLWTNCCKYVRQLKKLIYETERRAVHDHVGVTHLFFQYDWSCRNWNDVTFVFNTCPHRYCTNQIIAWYCHLQPVKNMTSVVTAEIFFFFLVITILT